MIHKVKVEKDFRKICEQIIDENKSIHEWCEIESDDMFQNGNYIGGFDATEEEFCFSYFFNEKEYWFQLSIDEIKKIIDNRILYIEITEPF
jgi:hypothetical protein